MDIYDRLQCCSTVLVIFWAREVGCLGEVAALHSKHSNCLRQGFTEIYLCLLYLYINYHLHTVQVAMCTSTSGIMLSKAVEPMLVFCTGIKVNRIAYL